MEMNTLFNLLVIIGLFNQILLTTSAATTGVSSTTPLVPLDEAPPLGDKCHPTPDSISEVFMIGYGSLISSISKNATYPNTGLNIPINVTGFSRNFNCKGSPIGLSTTYLGVDVGNGTNSFNGVLFKLPNFESLLEFDKREIYYCRKQVARKDIQFLIQPSWSSAVEQDYPGDGAQFWIYVVKPEFVGWPSSRYPIVQSYVDVYLGGCIEMEESYNLTWYKDACITSTRGWKYDWVNDRVLPRRPFVNTVKAGEIDKLLISHFPKHDEQVRIEQEIKYNSNGKSGSGKILVNNFVVVLAFVGIWM